jgi:hypothetical protein
MLVVEGVLFCNCCRMFLVNTAQAAAIRLACEVHGDPGAMAEVRTQFPRVVMDDETALLCARTIAGWKPFGPARLGRYCRVSPARRSERARQIVAGDEATTPAASSAMMVKCA